MHNVDQILPLKEHIAVPKTTIYPYDGLSPAIAVGTCAFFENKWMKGKTLEQRNAFFATRYIDDVLCMINKSYPQWKELAEDYKKNCYPKELELTEDDNTHFLECEIIPNGTRIESKHSSREKQC